MKRVLEYRTMRTFYLLQVVVGQSPLGISQISKHSGVSKSSLQRILSRLEKKGWIKINTINPYTENEITKNKFTGKLEFRKTYHLLTFPFLLNKAKLSKNEKEFWFDAARKLYSEIKEWAEKNYKIYPTYQNINRGEEIVKRESESPIWNNTKEEKEINRYSIPIIKSIPLQSDIKYKVHDRFVKKKSSPKNGTKNKKRYHALTKN